MSPSYVVQVIVKTVLPEIVFIRIFSSLVRNDIIVLFNFLILFLDAVSSANGGALPSGEFHTRVKR